MIVGDFKSVNPWIAGALGFVAVFALVFAWLVHWDNKPADPVNTWVSAKVAPQVKGVAKETITPKRVKVYGSKAKVKLKLPDEVKEDTNKHVIESTSVEASDSPHTVTSVVDSETGEVQTYIRKEPLPWVAWDTHGEAGLYGGIKNGHPAVRLEAKQGIFQVKSVHFGVVGSIDQPLGGAQTGPDYFVGVGAWARW